MWGSLEAPAASMGEPGGARCLHGGAWRWLLPPWGSLEAPAAFMQTLSTLVQHLPLERGRADLGSGVCRALSPQGERRARAPGLHYRWSLFTNSIMKRPSKDKASSFTAHARAFLGKCCWTDSEGQVKEGAGESLCSEEECGKRAELEETVRSSKSGAQKP